MSISNTVLSVHFIFISIVVKSNQTILRTKMAGTSATMSIISVIDIDAFEVQLWQKRLKCRPGGSLRDHPPTVVADSSGRILSVNPAAKKCQISRDLRLRPAQNLYPNLIVLKKPDRWGKPSTQEVREASYKFLICVKEYLSRFTQEGSVILEYKNGDEIFLDLTKVIWSRHRQSKFKDSDIHYESHKTCKSLTDLQQCPEFKNFSHGQSQISFQLKLIYAGSLMIDLVNYIKKKTEFHSSAGISYTKALAKTACKLNKPEAVTILTESGFHRIKENLSVQDISGIGPTLKEKIEQKFGPSYLEVKNLANVSLTTLISRLGQENGQRVHQTLQGTFIEKVISKEMTNAISCGKNNPKLVTPQDLLQAVENLAGEMLERVEEEKIRHQRTPKFINIRIAVGNEANNCLYTRLPFLESEELKRLVIRIITKAKIEFGYIHPLKVCRIELAVREFQALLPYWYLVKRC